MAGVKGGHIEVNSKVYMYTCKSLRLNFNSVRVSFAIALKSNVADL